MKENDRSYPRELYPKVKCSNDMGWQKRSSGRRCDSNSGHSFLVGALQRHPFLFALVLKCCKLCIMCEDKEDDAPDHDCHINHTGSSGSMEPAALVDLVHRLCDDFKVEITDIVTDDDSSMKSAMRWTNADHLKHHGERPYVYSKSGNRRLRADNGHL